MDIERNILIILGLNKLEFQIVCIYVSLTKFILNGYY